MLGLAVVGVCGEREEAARLPRVWTWQRELQVALS